MSQFNTLNEWLAWLEQLHSKTIDLGLERVYEVATRMGLISSPSELSRACSGALAYAPTQVITVAGTNGKGSCIASLEALLLAQGESVGSYTSPHFHHYCERIRINGQMVSENDVCRAFAAVNSARAEISLTYFEFGTLAALWLFADAQIPYVLLEVGLGGRLDAVNIVDASIAVITSIDIDHQEWLGNDRDGIAQEKLGVARLNRPLVIAESRHTPTLVQAIEHYPAVAIGRDYRVTLGENDWILEQGEEMLSLPNPSLPLPSVAAAVVTANLMGKLPSLGILKDCIASLGLPGRFQEAMHQGHHLIYDVAHNPAAAEQLASKLVDMPESARIHAVFALMADKDINNILRPLLPMIDHWYVGDLNGVSRAASVSQLANLLETLGQSVTCKPSINDAFISALAESNSHDRILIFGSFYTVSAIQQFVSESGAKFGRTT